MGLSIVQPGSYRRAPARRPACGLQAANSPPPGPRKIVRCAAKRDILRNCKQLRKTSILRNFSLRLPRPAPGATPLAPSARLATLPSAPPSRSLPVRARPHCRSRLGCTSCSPSCAPAVLPSPCPAVPVPALSVPQPARARGLSLRRAPVPPQLGGEQIWPSPPKLGGRDLSAALIQCGYLWRPMSQCTVTMSCRIYLARTVRADDHITRYPQQLARPLKVFGHRLPRPVLAPVTPPLKYPDFTSLRKQRLAQLSRQIYPSGPTGFGFPHRRSGGAGDLLRAQRQHVADAQPGL